MDYSMHTFYCTTLYTKATNNFCHDNGTSQHFCVISEESVLDPPPKRLCKCNTYASILEFMKSTIISYVYRESKRNVVKHLGQLKGDCPIINVKTLTIWNAIRTVIITKIANIYHCEKRQPMFHKFYSWPN